MSTNVSQREAATFLGVTCVPRAMVLVSISSTDATNQALIADTL